MLIHVVHKDGSYDFVSTSGLALLIATKEIKKFERFDGWIDINSPSIRKANNPGHHTGTERRLH